jgi:hypothetical protein
LGGEETEVENGSKVIHIQEAEQIERELEVEEIVEAVKKLKKGKAAGIDGILMKAWKYEGGKVKKRLVDLLTSIWNGDVIPEDWRRSDSYNNICIRKEIRRKWKATKECRYVQHIRSTRSF